jgi:hypothetical protein
MEVKPKKCEGINKAYGFEGCGILSLYREKGLCPKCFNVWRKTNMPKPILQVSTKRQLDNKTYSVLRVKFLSENKICPITGTPTTDIHHKKGRVGSLFLDVRYWIALSRKGHKYVEEHPKWAKQNGYSLKRLDND